jgi:hypothetical protein
MRRSLAVPVVAALLLLPALPGRAETIELPAPQSEQLSGVELLGTLGTPTDQLPGYILPGPVSNNELVQVTVSADGSVKQVLDDQRIRVNGSGDYFIREAGPARRAVATGDEPPVLNLGDVIWQGFSTGSRQLSAQLELDPDIESHHLPLQVRLAFTASDGRKISLAPGARVPGQGTVTLTVSNTTEQKVLLPTAQDAPARPVAAVLDRMLAAARSAAPARLPTDRTGLPSELSVVGATARQASQQMPLQLRGTLSSITADPTPGRATPGRAIVGLETMLTGTSRFTLSVPGPGSLALDLTAVPALDADTLLPPRGAKSWSAWAAADPPIAERKAALDVLVQTAATGSRASAYSPYLGSQLEGGGQTTFHYMLAATLSAGTTAAPLSPRPLSISLAVVGALVLAGLGFVLWRKS